MFSPFGTHGSYHWWPYNVNPAGGTTTQGDGALLQAQRVQLRRIYQNEFDNDCTDSRGNSGYDDFTYYSLSWTDPVGTTHPSKASIVYEDTSCQRTNPPPYIIAGQATDGSGFSIGDDGSGNPLVFDNTGNQVYPRLIDRYGNYFSADAQGNLMDDTGRVPVIVTQNGNVTYYDVLAPNGPINNNGTRVRYTVTIASVPVATNFQQSDTYEWNPQTEFLTPVQSIQLPDGSSYTFGYDSYGELNSLTLPTGGVVQYGYSNFVDSSQTSNRWLTSRRLGSNPAMVFTPSVVTQCANYSTGCVEQEIVHQPNGDEWAYGLNAQQRSLEHRDQRVHGLNRRWSAPVADDQLQHLHKRLCQRILVFSRQLSQPKPHDHCNVRQHSSPAEFDFVHSNASNLRSDQREANFDKAVGL